MSEFQFRPAVRENVGLLIGLAGGTGSGKSYTADRLAAGIAGDKPFAVIDTESRRALHYADQFNFHHAELRAPFTPKRYEEAILAADAAGYPVIVVDSMSHEHAGEGGLLEWHDAELDRMAGDKNAKGYWSRREAVNMAAWIAPKNAHKHMVQRLLQVKAHLILCFRAEEKIEMVKNSEGKWQIQPKQTRTGLEGWVPICEKSLPFELTVSLLLTAEKPGVPKPIKLQQQHKHLFPLDKPIDEDSGRRLAQWAAGGEIPRQERQESSAASAAVFSNSTDNSEGVTGDSPYISVDQALALETRCDDNKISVQALRNAAKVERLSMIKKEDYARADAWIDTAIERRLQKGATSET